MPITSIKEDLPFYEDSREEDGRVPRKSSQCYITWTVKKKNPSFYLPSSSYSQLRAQTFCSFLRSYRKQMVTPSFEFVNEITQNQQCFFGGTISCLTIQSDIPQFAAHTGTCQTSLLMSYSKGFHQMFLT